MKKNSIEKLNFTNYRNNHIFSSMIAITQICNHMKDLLTVVIPCKNEGKYIFRTLYRLNEQVGIRGIRVIIADGGSTDSTLDEINKFNLTHHKLKIEVIPGGPVSYARNQGAAIASTPYILFLDADTVLLSSDSILKCLFQLFRGKTICTCKTKSVSSTFMSKLVFWTFNHIQRLTPETFCTGQFFMIKKHDFEFFGKFDESVTHSEDYLLSRQIPKRDFVIVDRWVGQDDRRFRKMGYMNFILLIMKNYINRNNLEYFKKDVGYWE